MEVHWYRGHRKAIQKVLSVTSDRGKRMKCTAAQEMQIEDRAIHPATLQVESMSYWYNIETKLKKEGQTIVYQKAWTRQCNVAHDTSNI